MDADVLGTMRECALLCKVSPDNEADMAVLSIIREGVAGDVADHCKKTEGFKPGTRLEFLKLVQREWTIYMQGAHGIASESGGGITTTYRDGWPADTLAVLDRDRKVKVI